MLRIDLVSKLGEVAMPENAWIGGVRIYVALVKPGRLERSRHLGRSSWRYSILIIVSYLFDLNVTG